MKSSPTKTRITGPLLILVLLIAGGFGYRYSTQKVTAQAQPTTQSMKTKQVRTGSITLATSGSVTLVAGQESNLAFSVSGTVKTLNAAVGDQVKKGQVLAQLDNLEELEANIKNAEQDVLSAQQDLAAFKSNAPANLANAQLQVIKTQEALEKAQSGVVQKDSVRCSEETRAKLLDSYNRAVDKLTALGDGGGSASYYFNTILPQKQRVDQALGTYQACAGFSDYQVASSQASLSLAQAVYQQAQDTLDLLTKNNGLNPIQLATAENKVATAQQALETANDNLAGATLTAPFDGTVLSVEGKTGDAIEVSSKNKAAAFITIADLAHPLLKFNIDETDLTMVAVGEEAIITFDAFPNRSFKGAVIRVDPTLSSNDNGSKVTGLVQMDLSQETDMPAFPKSLSGSVQIIQARVENVLLVPLEALREQSDGTYGVYVSGANGQTLFKPVTVGMMDVASVEIKSGLSASDVVILSEGQ